MYLIDLFHTRIYLIYFIDFKTEFFCMVTNLKLGRKSYKNSAIGSDHLLANVVRGPGAAVRYSCS